MSVPETHTTQLRVQVVLPAGYCLNTAMYFVACLVDTMCATRPLTMAAPCSLENAHVAHSTHTRLNTKVVVCLDKIMSFYRRFKFNIDYWTYNSGPHVWVGMNRPYTLQRVIPVIKSNLERVARNIRALLCAAVVVEPMHPILCLVIARVDL